MTDESESGEAPAEPVIGGEEVRSAARWAWTNREWLLKQLNTLRQWLWPKKAATSETQATEVPSAPSVLILGPGGCGKTTLGRVLTGQVTGF